MTDTPNTLDTTDPSPESTAERRRALRRDEDRAVLGLWHLVRRALGTKGARSAVGLATISIVSGGGGWAARTWRGPVGAPAALASGDSALRAEQQTREAGDSALRGNDAQLHARLDTLAALLREGLTTEYLVLCEIAPAQALRLRRIDCGALRRGGSPWPLTGAAPLPQAQMVTARLPP